MDQAGARRNAGTNPAPKSGPFESVASRPNVPLARNLACLGSTIVVKGTITSEEDLQIDGKVEGPIQLDGQKLTVGQSGQLKSEVTAREIVVYGKVTGNLRARDRVIIKKDGFVAGDITTARISIEDGAYFKGRIEIARTDSPARAEAKPEAALLPA